MNVDNSDVDFQFGPGMTLSGNTAGGNPALVHWDFNAESVRYNPLNTYLLCLVFDSLYHVIMII